MQGKEEFRDWFYQMHSGEVDKPVVTLDCTISTLVQQAEALVEAAYCAGYTKGLEVREENDND